LLFLFVSSAQAGYEEVGTFGKDELETVAAMAVNVDGAGGVPPGTIYAVTEGGKRVARYTADGEFREAWGYGVGVAQSPVFQRCGPDGELAYPTCVPINTVQPVGEGPGQFPKPIGVAVDQTTGNVYVVDQSRKQGVVQVFNPDGSVLIGSFGERGIGGETFAQGPGKVHRSNPAGIAVDDSGTVYLSDAKGSFGPDRSEEFRVMRFEPESPGDYAHYVYLSGGDIARDQGATRYVPLSVALDDAENLYVSSDETIYKFIPGQPNTPTCEFQLDTGGIEGMTVNQENGEVFYFGRKGKREIHQLGSCAAGQFAEVATVPVAPKTEDVDALAYNPALLYEEDGPDAVTFSPGILYAGDAASRSLGGGAFERGLGHIYAQPEALVPTVDAEAVSLVGVSSATLSARLNPNGLATEYHFEYVTEAAYQANGPAERFLGAGAAPVGGASAGNGVSPVSVSATIAGLTPDTEYRFRVVAVNSEGITSGDGQSTFHTFAAGAAGLPAGLAYELVSPAQKNGGEVFPLNSEEGSCGSECKPGKSAEAYPRQISADGDAIAYEGFAFAPGVGASVFNAYISKRTASGWTTVNISPALLGSNDQGYKAFNSDLSQGLFYQRDPSLTDAAPPEYSNLYSQLTASPAVLLPVLADAPPNQSAGHAPGSFSVKYADSTKDLSQLFFAANDALTGAVPGIAPAAVNGGALKMNLYESTQGGLRLVNVLPGNATTVPGAYFGSKNQSQGETSNLSHALSTDGSRVFWSSESGQVYVRIDGSTTLELPDHVGNFLTASADGAKVLLTNGLLYEVDALGDPPVDLTLGKGGFKGIVGQSEDLSSIFFVDTAALTEVPDAVGKKAQAGANNLYAWHDGVTKFVATLVPQDSPGTAALAGTWAASPANRTAESSPNGQWVAFLSSAPVISSPSTPVPEVYLYDSLSGALTCPSCNPTGAQPKGSSSLSRIPQVTGAEEALPQPRYLFDSGRLFFDSQDQLSPFDTNGNVEDVYRYDPEGSSCNRAGGCVSLISGGRGSSDSNFVAADPMGKNVFFTTRDQLVPTDVDALVDLYDARAGGGFTVEGSPSECTGEACQPHLPPPAEPFPSSATFTGPGNPKQSATCKKGYKKKKGRCVKKHKAKQAHGKKKSHQRSAK
jgi:hypothetical protein